MDDVDVLFFLSLVLAAVVGWRSYQDGKESMVNELCNIKVYDFCQQVSQRYELKEFKE